MIAYKFLHGDGTSVFSDLSWPLPGDGPGVWVREAIEPPPPS